MSITAPPFCPDDDTNGLGIARPGAAHLGRVPAIGPSDEGSLHESQISWLDLGAVCAAGVAGWALVIGAGWYITGIVGDILPTVLLLNR